MMGFYSFIVMAPGEVTIHEHLIVLDGGRNVFNAQVDDLQAFTKRLTDEGVTVIQVNRLDEYEAVDPLDDIELEEDPFSDESPPLPGAR